MARRSVTAAFAAAFAWFSVTLTTGQAAEPVKVHSTATRTTETIRIDGRLDEAAWQATTPLSRFVQREPVEGGEPSEETEIRVPRLAEPFSVDTPAGE